MTHFKISIFHEIRAAAAKNCGRNSGAFNPIVAEQIIKKQKRLGGGGGDRFLQLWNISLLELKITKPTLKKVFELILKSFFLVLQSKVVLKIPLITPLI